MKTQTELKPGQTFYLGWDKDILYIFEKKKSKQTVEAISEKIKQGCDFDAVPVDRVGKNKFTLTRAVDENDIQVGGHNRALAHFMNNTPLKCFLSGDQTHNENNYADEPTVRDMQLIDDPADLKWRRAYYPAYLQK